MESEIIMLDLELDQTTHDLKVTNFDLKILSDDDELIQRLKIKFLFFFGEWFLDTTKGIKYFEEIMKKNPNINTVDNIFKRTILEEPEVKLLTEYKTVFDSELRAYSVVFTAVKNDNTVIQFNEDITL